MTIQLKFSISNVEFCIKKDLRITLIRPKAHFSLSTGSTNSIISENASVFSKTIIATTEKPSRAAFKLRKSTPDANLNLTKKTNIPQPACP